MNAPDNVIERIRKMITLANDGGATEGERDNAMRMAHKTLAKYNLDLTEVMEGGSQARVDNEPREHLRERYFGQPWARQVSMAIGELFFCNYFYLKLGANTDDVLHSFVGKHSNIVTAFELSKFVVKAIYKEGMAYRKARNAPYATYRAFAQGAMAHVLRRCEALRKESEQESEQEKLAAPTTGTALVLANYYQQELDANAQFIRDMFGGKDLKARKGSGSREAHDYDAQYAGYRYGGQVSLNVQVSSTKPATRIGEGK